METALLVAIARSQAASFKLVSLLDLAHPHLLDAGEKIAWKRTLLSIAADLDAAHGAVNTLLQSAILGS